MLWQGKFSQVVALPPQEPPCCWQAAWVTLLMQFPVDPPSAGSLKQHRPVGGWHAVLLHVDPAPPQLPLAALHCAWVKLFTH